MELNDESWNQKNNNNTKLIHHHQQSKEEEINSEEKQPLQERKEEADFSSGSTLSCNGNNITQRQSLPSPHISNNIERTEGDAVHPRLRNDRHPRENYLCQSCGQQFQGTTIIQVYEHYAEHSHLRFYSSCLYCGGKVHRYLHLATKRIEIYHNCFRWKRGEDQ